jgi:hypothetical protein
MAYQNKFLSRKSTLTGSPLHQPSPAVNGGAAPYSQNSSNVVSPVENSGGLQRKGSKVFDQREPEGNLRKYSLTQALSNGSGGGPNSATLLDGELDYTQSPALAINPNFHLRRTQSQRGMERSPAALQRTGTLTTKETTTPSFNSGEKQFFAGMTFPQIDDRYLRLDYANEEYLSKLQHGDLLPKGTPEATREFMSTLVTLLLNYVEMQNDRTTRVLEFRHPKQLEQIVDIDIPDAESPSNLYQVILDCQQALQYQVRSGACRLN